MVIEQAESRVSRKADVNHIRLEERAYAVVRSGIRVSELDHDNEFSAQDELDHWNRILNMWPDGTKVSIIHVRRKAA